MLELLFYTTWALGWIFIGLVAFVALMVFIKWLVEETEVFTPLVKVIDLIRPAVEGVGEFIYSLVEKIAQPFTK